MRDPSRRNIEVLERCHICRTSVFGDEVAHVDEVGAVCELCDQIEEILLGTGGDELTKTERDRLEEIITEQSARALRRSGWPAGAAPVLANRSLVDLLEAGR